MKKFYKMIVLSVDPMESTIADERNFADTVDGIYELEGEKEKAEKAGNVCLVLKMDCPSML